MRVIGRVVVFVSLWLIFESLISWLAFCDPASHDYGQYKAPDDYCSAFKGPLVSLIRGSFIWIRYLVRDEHDALNALGTLVIAFFTFTLWWSTHRLWDAGERQLKLIAANAAEQSRDMKASVDAARDAASAAQKSADVGERTVNLLDATAERQLRAYLHVHDVRMSLMNTKYNPNIQVIIKNYGQTPARHITHTCRCMPIARPPHKNSFSLSGVAPFDLADLGPTQQTFASWSIPINQWNGMKPQLSTRTESFYVFGRIDYFDAFERPWWTEYRYRLMIDSTGIPDETSLVVDSREGNITV